jgi:drug/metabolite transporter (DMT)-like permease
VLFGLSTPLAKLLLPDAGPLMLAALLYLGAGLGLTTAGYVVRRPSSAVRPREAPLRRSDLALLVAIVAAGGVAGPLLMLWGLARVSAVVGSLLLNLEGPLTMILAVALFGEHLGSRAAAGAAMAVAGAAVVGYAPGDVRTDWYGDLAIVGACLAWAVDNNLTQQLSVRDPIAVAKTKGLAAGFVLLGIALTTGAPLPGPRTLIAALALGLVSYGLSVALAVRAMRMLGAARQSAFFAVAPFIGAVAAVPILGESFGLREASGGGLIALGVSLLLAEVHDHWHVHDGTEHDHTHVHDVHHRHAHPAGESGGEPHTHVHVHFPLSHAHPHVSDIHHRHRH